jgi:hypothetical protein
MANAQKIISVSYETRMYISEFYYDWTNFVNAQNLMIEVTIKFTTNVFGNWPLWETKQKFFMFGIHTIDRDTYHKPAGDEKFWLKLSNGYPTRFLIKRLQLQI